MGLRHIYPASILPLISALAADTARKQFHYHLQLKLLQRGEKKPETGTDASPTLLPFTVIVILFVMRKRYQKDSLAHMKNSGEIHEQLVTYDEEGGGEMDTNGYVWMRKCENCVA